MSVCSFDVMADIPMYIVVCFMNVKKEHRLVPY